MVTVLVFGLTLRDAVGGTEFELDVLEPTTVRKLVESNQDRLGPLVQFLANREVMIAVNKKVSAEDTIVKDGDIVKLSHQSRMSYDGTRDIPPNPNAEKVACLTHPTRRAKTRLFPCFVLASKASST